MSNNANEKCNELNLINSLGEEQNGKEIGVIVVINGLNRQNNNIVQKIMMMEFFGCQQRISEHFLQEQEFARLRMITYIIAFNVN